MRPPLQCPYEVQSAEPDVSDSLSRPWYQFSLKWILCAIGYAALVFGVWKNDIESTLGAILFVPLLISTLVILLALLRWSVLWLIEQSFGHDEENAGLPDSTASDENPPNP